MPTCYRHPGRETHIRCQRCERAICPDCMRDAAVGFQCPSCVASGRKETRVGRTPYGGLVPDKPGAITSVLIGINAVIWVVIMATGRYGSALYQHLALSPLGSCASAHLPDRVYPTVHSQVVCTTQVQGGDGNWIHGVADGAPWQLLTSTFTHVEVWHIAFNMYALWILGPQLELVLGRVRFIALYLLAGLAGSVCVLWLASTDTPTIGASGAIFGLMGAQLVIGHKVGADLSSLWVLLAVNAVLSFTIPHVSWQGHLGGLVGGALVAAIIAYAPRERRTLVQYAGMGAVLLALAGAAVARIGMLA
ncbi:rhomboid family intramembrane serine protease [Nocardioides montaniterrae]